MTNLFDIYVASGATLSEDGKSVVVTPGQTKPFEIILTVIPIEMEFDGDIESVTFSVLLDDTMQIQGNNVRHIEHYDTVKLPVSQVVIK